MTFDDLDSDIPSKIMRYFFKLLLPIYEYTYMEKLAFIFNLFLTDFLYLLITPKKVQSIKQTETSMLNYRI